MNKILERQLKKVFGSLEAVPKGIEHLLDLISATYDHNEEDRLLIERSMEISSRELGDLNARLRSESEALQIKFDELARAEQSEKSTRDIFDTMQEGCAIISPEWVYLYANDALAKQTLYTKTQLLGHTAMELFPGIEQTELYARIKRCFETRESQELQTEFTFPNGSSGWFQLKIEPVPQGIFILSTDITASKREAEETKKRTDELERLNKLMIDRELKMIELKKEIAALKAGAT